MSTYTAVPDRFVGAKELSEMLGVSMSQSYKIIKALNDELKAMGKLIVRGKISRRYLEEKLYV